MEHSLFYVAIMQNILSPRAVTLTGCGVWLKLTSTSEFSSKAPGDIPDRDLHASLTILFIMFFSLILTQ